MDDPIELRPVEENDLATLGELIEVTRSRRGVLRVRLE